MIETTHETYLTEWEDIERLINAYKAVHKSNAKHWGIKADRVSYTTNDYEGIGTIKKLKDELVWLPEEGYYVSEMSLDGLGTIHITHRKNYLEV
jgi:hypothetical protein